MPTIVVLASLGDGPQARLAPRLIRALTSLESLGVTNDEVVVSFVPAATYTCNPVVPRPVPTFVFLQETIESLLQEKEAHNPEVIRELTERICAVIVDEVPKGTKITCRVRFGRSEGFRIMTVK